MTMFFGLPAVCVWAAAGNAAAPFIQFRRLHIKRPS
jgi:hypothetical protein